VIILNITAIVGQGNMSMERSMILILPLIIMTVIILQGDNVQDYVP
jgi:hypothetical protein